MGGYGRKQSQRCQPGRSLEGHAHGIRPARSKGQIKVEELVQKRQRHRHRKQDGTVFPVFAQNDTITFSNSGHSSGISTIGYELNRDSTAATYPFSVHYYHGDQIGSSRLMTAGTGWPIWQGTFLPFGEEYSPQVSSNHYKFTGKERDIETGLYYFGARYYSNGLGRFTSVDPKMISKQRMFDPQQWNMYQYSRNNPIVNVDPDGRETTIFYRAPGAGGSSGSPKDFGHIFIHVRNSQTGKGAYFDFYPDGKASVIGKVDQQRLDNHARLTIQTTPQQEQKMLDAISTRQNNVPKYEASASSVIHGTECTCVTHLRIF